MAELAQKLTADAKTTDEKVHRLETYVRSLGTCRLSLLQTGYRLRPASEVIRSAYGTIEEKVCCRLRCNKQQVFRQK